MNTLLLTLFCFVSCVISIDLSGVSDDQIRSCLLGALKRFHLKSPPLKVAPPSLVQTSTENLFERIPIDTKIDLFEKFLDYDSFITFKRTNSHYAQIPDNFIFRRLAKFNPYYLVEDEIVNKLLFAVISRHFVKSKNLQSPHIYDELELLILKLNFGVLDFEAIPKRIYFCLIAFINETIHGLNAGIPLNQFQVVTDFATLLRQHEMPESLQFFKDNKKSFKEDILGPNIDTDLDFLHSKPSKEEIRARFAFDSSNVDRWLNSSNPKWLTYSVIELFAHEIPYNQLVRLNTKILSKKPFLGMLRLLPDNQDFLERLIWRSFFIERVEFCAIYAEKFNTDLPDCYLMSRNFSNEFSIEFSIDEPSSLYYVLNALEKARYFNLYMIEVLVIIFRSGVLPHECVDFALRRNINLNMVSFKNLKELISF
jgi:hypothetical protein